MSTATGDGGGSGAGAAVELEFENIDDAVKTMKNLSDTIGTVQKNFQTFANSVKTSDWSNEPSCVQFATSYKAAVDVYATVISGMKADLARYSAALEAASNSYKTSDDNATAALAKLGAVDDSGLSQDTKGQGTYHDDKHHGELSSDKPEQATDTTPGDSRDTTMPGEDKGSPDAAPKNDGAGQSTQPHQNNGTSQGGPNGGNGASYASDRPTDGGSPTLTNVPAYTGQTYLQGNNAFNTEPDFTSGASQGGTTR